MFTKDDEKRLNTPYAEGAAKDPEGAFERDIGVECPKLEALAKAIFADFDENLYGIGWWAPHLGTKRRILVSDHLAECVGGIQVNLAEAKLHLMSVLGCWERRERFLSRFVQLDTQGRPVPKHPGWKKPADHLPDRMAALHQAGFFRALGSAFDCLGAVYVGVLAIRSSLVKADASILRRWPPTTLKRPETPGLWLRREACAAFERLLERAGPPSWFDWTIDYRNMLVHRGRRIWLVKLGLESRILDPAGRPVPRTVPVPLLQKDPGMSEMEALHGSSPVPMPTLSESANVTLQELFKSAHFLVEHASVDLLRYWNVRRNDPTLLVQPADQWKDVPSTKPRGFPGFAPGTVSASGDTLMTAPDAVRRPKVSALLGDDHKKWANFD